MNGKYHMTYALTPRPEGISKADVPEGAGACDSIIIHSIIGVPGNNESLSLMTLSADGTKSDRPKLTPEQQFIIWTMWADGLAKSLPPGGKQELASLVIETIRYAHTTRRGAVVSQRDPHTEDDAGKS